MNIEEYLESIPDIDLEIAIKELKEIEESNKEIRETSVLNEICCSISDIMPEDDREVLISRILKEYSYRKAGLK